jgi:hypothetical protein
MSEFVDFIKISDQDPEYIYYGETQLKFYKHIGLDFTGYIYYTKIDETYHVIDVANDNNWRSEVDKVFSDKNTFHRAYEECLNFRNSSYIYYIGNHVYLIYPEIAFETDSELTEPIEIKSSKDLLKRIRSNRPVMLPDLLYDMLNKKNK